MRTTFLILLGTLFYVPLYSQSEFKGSIMEECLSFHLKYFSLSNGQMGDTIYMCTATERSTKYLVKNPFHSLNQHPILLLSPKDMKKRQEETLYPIYYITVKRLNKSEQLIYIATMSVKHSNHILYFRNAGANSQYLIEHKKIKKISVNGEILYQE